MNLECIRNHLRTPAGEKTLKAFAIFSVAILITTALFYAYRKEEREKESVIRITGTETISGLTGDHTTFENGRYHIDADIEIGGEGSLTIQNAVVVFAENHGMNVLTGGTLTIVNSVITSEGTWGGIECSGTLDIKGSALLNAGTAVTVNSGGYAEITGTTITNSGTALTTSSSPTTTSTTLENCLITGNDIGIETTTGPTITTIFNPNMRDNLPPEIRNFEVKSEVTYNHHWYGNTVEHCWAEFDADIYDAAGIEYIVMTVEDRGRSETLYQQGDNHYQTCIDISYLRDYLVDYNVAVLAVDTNVNRAEADDTIDGVLVGAVKDLCEKLVDSWNACAEWAIEGLSWIGNYLVNKAMEILQPLLDAVNDGFENFGNGMATNMYEGYTNAGLIGAFADVLGYIFTSSLYFSLIAIVVALFVIEILVKCITGGSDSLATPVLLPTLITMIKYAIIGKIAEEASEGFESHGNDIQDFFKGFGIPFSVIGMGLTVYKGFALHKGGGTYLSPEAKGGALDIIGFIFGIIGVALVLYEVVLDTSIDDLINLFMDVVGLVFDIKGAYDAYGGKLDLILWVGALADATAYVSLSVSLISMGLTDYSDAVEQLS